MEGIQTRQLELAGGTLCVTQLPPMRGFKLLTRLGKVTTPAFAQLATLTAYLEDDFTEHGDIFARAASLLFANMDESTVESMVMELFATAELLRDGKHALGNPQGFNRAFLVPNVGVDYKSIVAAIGFALKVNYGDFIDDVLEKLRAAFRSLKGGDDKGGDQTDASQNLPTTSETPGQSGDSG